MGDPHGQTLFILRKIDGRIGDADPVGRAHAELLGGVRPAMTMAEVSGLMMTEHLVEIEVDAVVTAEEDGDE